MFYTVVYYNGYVQYTLGGGCLNTQFKKGVLELCILHVINEEDMYGFEVIDKLANVLDVNENTIYPILRRLTKQGHFEIYEKDSPFGARRKYYKITSQGKECLEVYLKEWESFLKSVQIVLYEEGAANEK